MQRAVEGSVLQGLGEMGGELFGRKRAVDHHGVDRDAALGEVAREVAGAVLTGEIKEPRRRLKSGRDEINQIGKRAVSRNRVCKTGRTRGLGAPVADREAGRARELATTRVRGKRARRI